MKRFEGGLRYRNLDGYLKDTYGKKVFKVALDGGFTCPNKDGTKGYGGCIFCSPSGSGDFAGNKSLSLQDQYQKVKTLMNIKWPDAYTIAYFQANTNTYAPIETLEECFSTALSLDESIVGLSIATRCDALDDDVVHLLKKYQQKTHVQIELGLQSIHEKTALWMHRGHDLHCLEKAISKLHEHRFDIVVHIINGFPNESKEDMIETALWLNSQPIHGVKIHMLHVMEDTALGALYKENRFPLLSLEDYVEITAKQLERLNPNFVIHRLTGDSPKETLIAPLWTLKKFVVLNEIEKWFKRHNTYQGIYYREGS